MKPSVDYTLYLVTDRDLMSTPTLEEAVEQAIRGVTLVQLREKHASSLEFYQTALRVKKITDSYNVPLIINDRVDVALAVDADGVHVGQSDLPAARVRKSLVLTKSSGCLLHRSKKALKAVEDGADYLGVGAMFATGTKTDADITTIEELKRIRQAVSVPIVVIGGINKQTLPLFAGTGIDGIAVVSAIIAAADVEKAARELKELFKQIT